MTMADKTERPQPPREFGRDGISGMVNRDRSIRAREVSQPSQSDYAGAEQILPRLLARAQGRRLSP